jgi:hypothetical protein
MFLRKVNWKKRRLGSLTLNSRVVTIPYVCTLHLTHSSAVQRFYILGRIWLMAVEARAPCGDCNNNNKVILIIILIKIITDLIFYDSISWNILKFTRNNFLSVNRKVRARVNWVKTDLWHPEDNSDRYLKADSAQMHYLFEGITWDAGDFSNKKGKCGVRGP